MACLQMIASGSNVPFRRDKWMSGSVVKELRDRSPNLGRDRGYDGC